MFLLQKHKKWDSRIRSNWQRKKNKTYDRASTLPQIIKFWMSKCCRIFELSPNIKFWMSKCCLDIRAESEYQVLKCYFDMFWHSSWVIITLDDFSSILFNSGCFDIFWHLSWVIFRHYSTRGCLSLVPKSPYLTLSGTGIKITVWVHTCFV